jgi:hypothetical protein
MGMNSEVRIYWKYKMAYLSSRLLLGFDSPCELIKRLMSVALRVKCVGRMIDIRLNDFGGDGAPSEGFQCAECEGLVEFGRWRTLHQSARCAPCHGKRMVIIWNLETVRVV